MKLNSLTSYTVLIAATSTAFFSCTEKVQSDKKSETIKYIDISNMDTTIKPGDDFFMYVNGAWIQRTNIPSDKPRYGSFQEVIDKTEDDVNAIIKDAKTTSNNAIEANIAKFYKAGMDSVAINETGLKTLQPLFDDINNIKDFNSLIKIASKHLTQGIGYFIGAYVDPDEKDVNKMTVYLTQTGLGLPNRDFYTQSDAQSLDIQSNYKNYIAQILTLSGLDSTNAHATAGKIYNIEYKLAQASLRQQDLRDPNKLYNKYQVSDFSKKTPSLNWSEILSDIKLINVDTFIVSTPNYYTELSKLLNSISIEDWKAYMKYHMISQFAPYLADNIYNTYFDFYLKKLKGQKEPEARWKRVQNVINNSIGHQLGQLYVEKKFKPEAKTKMIEMVGNLKKAFNDRIEKLDWMSNTTKVKAIEKLNSFVSKVGYPDVWKKYDNLTITEDNYIQNILNAFAFEYNYEVSKYGRPVNKDEWFMTPNTVNAYYYPSFNEIVFPAAILQFPFFDYNADDAINYGGIGAVIGHEMTHGFDDQGAKYAADGNLHNWWTDEDLEKFTAKADILVKQYDNFKILDSIPVNGLLTLGENIADLGGISIAYQAFKSTPQGQSQEKIDGFTPDQRFFMSWAQIWRIKATNEFLHNQIKTDYHSPGHARANVPLSNFEPFYQAFNVKEGDKMFLAEDKRCKIW